MAKEKTFEDLMRDAFQEEYEDVFVTDEEVESFSTGAMSLDVSLGVGGIPKGRISVIDGPESVGKTTIAFSIIRNALLSSPLRALYIDIENQMMLDYVPDLLGPNVDSARLVIAKPDTSDDAFNIAEAGIKSKAFSVIVFDSVAALAPIEEKEKDFEDANMAIIPRDIAKFLRRNVYAIRTTNLAFIFLNQVRDNIGSYVKSYSTPGGHALKHFASIIISLSKASEIKMGDETVGIMTKFTVKKNKLASPYRSHMIPIMFGKGVDSGRDAITFAELLGVVSRAGPYYKFDEYSWKGMNQAVEFVESNPEVLDKIRDLCYNRLDRGKQSKEESENEG